MPSVKIQPNVAINVEAQFDTMLRIFVEFQYQAPGTSTFATFFSANANEQSTNQALTATLNSPSPGGSVMLTGIFAGAEDTVFQGRIKFVQNGQPIGDSIVWNDRTGDSMAKVEQTQVDLR